MSVGNQADAERSRSTVKTGSFLGLACPTLQLRVDFTFLAGLCLTCTSLPQSSPRRLNSNPVLLDALPGHTRLRWGPPHSHSPVLSRRFPQDPLQGPRLAPWAAFPGTPNFGPVSRPALASALLPCCHWHCSSTSLPVCPQYCLLS